MTDRLPPDVALGFAEIVRRAASAGELVELGVGRRPVATGPAGELVDRYITEFAAYILETGSKEIAADRVQHLFERLEATLEDAGATLPDHDPANPVRDALLRDPKLHAGRLAFLAIYDEAVRRSKAQRN